MTSIFICTNNHKLFEKCTKVLSAEHVVSKTNVVNADCVADFIIVDTELLDAENQGFEKLQNHSAHILMAGSQWPEEKQLNAILHGASGYYDTSEPEIMLSKAVKQIIQGDIWVHRHLVPKLIQSLITSKKIEFQPSSADQSGPMIKTLSNREMDVANLVCEGESNKQIARSLNISERTVKAHLTSIFRKLNVTDRLHLVILLKENS